MDCMAAHGCADTRQIYVVCKICLFMLIMFIHNFIIIIIKYIFKTQLFIRPDLNQLS